MYKGVKMKTYNKIMKIFNRRIAIAKCLLAFMLSFTITFTSLNLYFLEKENKFLKETIEVQKFIISQDNDFFEEIEIFMEVNYDRF